MKWLREANGPERGTCIGLAVIVALAIAGIAIGPGWAARAAFATTLVAAGLALTQVRISVRWRRAFEQIRDGREHYREN